MRIFDGIYSLKIKPYSGRKFAFIAKSRNFALVTQNNRTMRKLWSTLVLLLLVGGALFFYFRFYFVFGEGVKSGELNYVVYKGVFFKTYEGKLIQSGLRSKAAGSIQSYEFEFSVENERVARELMLQSGNVVELHYKEYFGALPWRGFTKYIVDSIVSSRSMIPPTSMPAGVPIQKTDMQVVPTGEI